MAHLRETLGPCSLRVSCSPSSHAVTTSMQVIILSSTPDAVLDCLSCWSLGLPPESQNFFALECPPSSLNQHRWFCLPTESWCLIGSDGPWGLSCYVCTAVPPDCSFRLAWTFYPGGCLHVHHDVKIKHINGQNDINGNYVSVPTVYYNKLQYLHCQEVQPNFPIPRRY